MADQRWRDQPRRMSPATVDQVAARIGEHVRAHDLASVELVLHGGEPLLAGADLIAHAVRSVRRAVPAQVGASIQTNGVRLGAYLRLLDVLGVRVGVSLDGGAVAQDRHRRFAGGRGSHAAVAEALGRLSSPSFRHLFGGCCARSTSATRRWRRTRPCSPSTRRRSTFSFRTATGPLPRRAASRARPRRRTRTGGSPSSTAGTGRRGSTPRSGSSPRSSSYSSAGRPPARRWACRPSAWSSSRPTAASSSPTC
ncbi:hypothetical protein [Actinomadura sp. DC4]|uniref:hypothetical protein n=1 Tax=Actinomadura sp. DC4 TaxID=3055069 RepID=UPI0025B08085|nr:hypothetical protein [Actinomadura sp. DC4]MDN3353810.1 hypothetical protein [Actinomadura sp. DC4]